MRSIGLSEGPRTLVLLHGGMHGAWCWEPIAPLLEPLRITAHGFGAVPKVYLGSRTDRVLPWWLLEQMAAAAGAEMAVLTGDHTPFLSVPDEFVERVCRFAP